MDWQLAMVVGAVAWAAWFIGRGILRAARVRSACCGACPPAKNQVDRLEQITIRKRRATDEPLGAVNNFK